MLKSRLRKKILKIRKKINRNNIQIEFDQILRILKKEKINKKIIGGYYPVNFELNDLELLKKFEKKNFIISLPVIKKKFQMDFYKWSSLDLLKINKYGIPEPEKKEIEKNKEDYEKILDEAADEIESFVKKANLANPVQ